MTNELKPCPFCGGEAMKRVRSPTTCYIECAMCECGTKYEADHDAARTWNRRAPSEAVGLLRALMDRLDSHFGGPSNDWKEQEQARRFLAAQDKEST